jgi:SEC-C motif-containing protein
MLPENAEQLMRSRYSAYVLHDRDYLVQTWHSDHRPQDLILDDGIRWIGLEVIGFRQQEDQATVEFEARLLVAGRVDAVHENSRFVKQQGRWLYTSGDLLLPGFQPWSPGRNEACPCASGKKFKRCCMR